MTKLKELIADLLFYVFCLLYNYFEDEDYR